MRRPPRERHGELPHVDAMPLLEGGLADLVLIDVVGSAQADGPAVGGFEPHAAVSVGVNVGTVDGEVGAARNTAMMPSHPRAVCRAFARLARR